MHNRRCSSILAALLALIPVGSAFAASDSDCLGPSPDCVPVGGWNFGISFGAGVRTNPVVHESAIPLVVVPTFSYYGKRFFLDNLDAGVSLLESDHSTLSLIASPGYDRVFFYHSDPQNIFVTGFANSLQVPGSTTTLVSRTNPDGSVVQVPAVKIASRSRKVTYLAGPEWTFKYGAISGQLDVLHEITGHNHGDEVRGAVGVPLGQLGGSWTANAGFTWKSSKIVNYYYGEPGLYTGGAAFDPFVKLAFSKPLKGKWKLMGFVETERLGNAIADSPIVNARYVTTTFVGVMYTF